MNDTIKIFDLQSLERVRGGKLAHNEVSIYKLKTQGMTLNADMSIQLSKKNRLYFSLAQNELTDEVFFLFSDVSNGKTIKLVKSGKSISSNLSINARAIIRLIYNILKLDYEKDRSKYVLTLSDDLSKKDSIETYKVIKTKIS